MSNNSNIVNNNDNKMDTRDETEKDNYYINNNESNTRTIGESSAVEPLLSGNSRDEWRTSSGISLPWMSSSADNTSIATTISSSIINFQMPQNFLLPQVIPNFPNYLPSMPAMPNLPSLPDYLTQLPTLPTVSMPSMPNISMPSMPNLPSIPSLSDLMNGFPSRKPIKPWPQLRQAVKSSHRRFSEIGCRVPFMFNWREDLINKKIRIYFLSSINNSAEITLIYCDIDTDPNHKIDDEVNDLQVIESNIEKQIVNNAEEGKEEEQMTDSAEEFMPMSGNNNDINEAKNSNCIKEDGNRKPFWQQLIITSKSNVNFDTEPRNPSREENLQLERKRMMFSGITSYEFQQKSSRFVFTSGDSLFWFDDPLDNSNKIPPYLPNKLESTTSFIKMNPQLCPSDPNLVAYVADGDLWVCNLKSGSEFRLTETKFESDNDSESAIAAGLPSYVIQEEFRRYAGFWWRPDNEYDHINNSGDLSYTILCEFVDESEVDVVKIASWDGTVEEYRFPRAGQCNAESSLSIITFSLNPITNTISDVKASSLPKALNEIFPSFEYLVRCGWYSHDNLWLQLLNRQQNHLVLVLMSLHDSYPPQVIYEEKSNKWVNCHDILHFCNIGEDLSVGSVLKFIWSSEETGFRHLYSVKIQLVGNDNTDEDSLEKIVTDNEDAIDAKLPKLDVCHQLESNQNESQRSSNSDSNKSSQRSINEENRSNVKSSGSSSMPNGCGLNACTNSVNDFIPIETIRSKLVEKIQLTHGNWEVSDKEVWIDESNNLIYFTGLKESPLERHLYVISLNYPKLQPKRLTIEDFSHTTIAFNPSFSYFIDIQSNITIPPFGYLQRITSCENLPDAEPVSLFLGSSAHPGEDNDQIDLLPGMAAPQLFDYRLKSGDLLYGFIFKPECMEAGVRYPVLLEIYGGPEVQLVSKSFKAVRHCRRHLLASEGYIVVAFDSRGSKHRGVAFESHCCRRLGQVEIADQVEALQWLAENTDFIDMSRIAVHGWSYGGYLSLMALAQRPDIFKCAIAGAPVTNWQLYDTGYTERYMDTPQNNPEGYRLGNVMTHINSFPNEENRLLIIHGLMDENVHFAHTVQLIQALVKAGKPYQLNVYPFERHSLRHSQCSEHYETLLLSFLQNNL